MTEARTKEIGIRRVLGVPVSGITILFTKEFLKWMLLASMAAIPIVYFAVTKWLQNFVYRVDIETTDIGQVHLCCFMVFRIDSQDFFQGKQLCFLSPLFRPAANQQTKHQ
jgi:hypothetical protein